MSRLHDVTRLQHLRSSCLRINGFILVYMVGFHILLFYEFEEDIGRVDEIMPNEMKTVVPQFYHVMAFFLAFNRVFRFVSSTPTAKFDIDLVAVCFEFDYMDDICKFLIVMQPYRTQIHCLSGFLEGCS